MASPYDGSQMTRDAADRGLAGSAWWHNCCTLPVLPRVEASVGREARAYPTCLPLMLSFPATLCSMDDASQAWSACIMTPRARRIPLVSIAALCLPREVLLNQDNAEKAAGQGNQSCACGAALRAVVDCLAHVGGRLFLMTQSPANAGAGAVVPSREDPGLYGGDKEHRMYQPASGGGGSTSGTKKEAAAAVATAEFYRNLAKDCVARQVWRQGVR